MIWMLALFQPFRFWMAEISFRFFWTGATEETTLAVWVITYHMVRNGKYSRTQSLFISGVGKDDDKYKKEYPRFPKRHSVVCLPLVSVGILRASQHRVTRLRINLLQTIGLDL